MQAGSTEEAEVDYGLYTWPCAVELARYVSQQKDAWQGMRVLEIGCGTALPGMVAAKVVGCSTVLSDVPPQVMLHSFDSLR